MTNECVTVGGMQGGRGNHTDYILRIYNQHEVSISYHNAENNVTEQSINTAWCLLGCYAVWLL
jgi:hypothetical protein